MESTTNLLIFLGSTALIYFGSEYFIRGSAKIARALRISPFVIGVTFVAFGTSLPELVVSLIAFFNNHVDVAIGNVVGSNISNIGLILGLSAVLVPLAVHKHTFKFDLPFNLGIGLLLLALVWDGQLVLFESLVLLGGFVLFLIYYSRVALGQNREEIEILDEDGDQESIEILPNLLMSLMGLGALLVGAKLFLDSAVFFAHAFGLSEAVIGFTMVAFGTSLPELATSIMAIAKKEVDIGVGNILGSNIFNILLILGILGVLQPIVSPQGLTLSIYVMIGFTIALFPLMKSGFKLQRIEGVVLLLAYVLYILLLIFVLPVSAP